MKRPAVVLWSAIVFGAAFPGAQTRNTKPLDIYVVDTEGGKAALWVAPSGESVLIDGGAPASHSPAYWIKISAQSDDTFAITNSRNSFSKTYAKRQSER